MFIPTDSVSISQKAAREYLGNAVLHLEEKEKWEECCAQLSIRIAIQFAKEG
jgi:hypothetical protein